ncbi:hypothetical protein ACJX0J_036835, partial [Zea mays]
MSSSTTSSPTPSLFTFSAAAAPPLDLAPPYATPSSTTSSPTPSLSSTFSTATAPPLAPPPPYVKWSLCSVPPQPQRLCHAPAPSPEIVASPSIAPETLSSLPLPYVRETTTSESLRAWLQRRQLPLSAPSSSSPSHRVHFPTKIESFGSRDRDRSPFTSLLKAIVAWDVVRAYQSSQGNCSENDPNNTTVFVGGLDSNVDEEYLRQIFTP